MEFLFETASGIKKSPDVTVYGNGMVRFSKAAIERYGLRDAELVWGESESHDTLAMRKEHGGRRLRGDKKDATSCPLKIAERHVGKYMIECADEVMVLQRID